jgi:hypothetical protein
MSRRLAAAALGIGFTTCLAPATFAQAYVEPEVHEFMGASPAPVGDLFGWTTVAIGDVSGDGVTDIAVSASFTDFGAAGSAGRIYALSGADGSTLWTRTETLGSAIMGYTLEVTDWDGDGTLDVLAGAPFNGLNGGRVWVLDGDTGATLHMLNHAGGTSQGFGAGLATGGDWNGDGTADVVVGSILYDNAVGTDVGRVYIFSTGSGALLTTIDGPVIDGEFGLGTAFLGDVTVPPDGRDEIVIGHRDQIEFFDGFARVYSFDGVNVSELYAVGGVGMGYNIIGDRIDAGKDVNLDGFPDFMVGDMFRSEVKVFSGLDGAPLYTLDGNGEGGSFTPGHLIDDVDEDGHADLVIGAWSNDDFANNTGKVFLYSGASGTVLRTITPTLDTRRMGIDVRTIGDFNGDGSVDFVIGSYGGGSPGPPRGRVHVISGHFVGGANTLCSPELLGDPLLADTGGDPTTGPLIGHPIEVFDVSLNCTGSTAPGPYVVAVRLQKNSAPVITSLGHLWLSGTKLFTCSGMHAMDTVDCVPGGLVVPNDASLVGVSYTVQGVCGGGNARLSGALTQTVAN